MSSSALDHPMVRDYLGELDTALAALPADQAAELREQITAHLDDALLPGADDQLVAAVLGRLGQPDELAAEAAAAADNRPTQATQGLRAQRTRLRRRIGAAVVLAVTLVAAWISYVVAMHNVDPLQARGPSMWWYPEDSARQVITHANGIAQTTVPVRPGQRQGLVVDIYNPSNLTQTVLAEAYGNWYQSPGAQSAQFGVSVQGASGGTRFHALSYGLPGMIPPHQTRAIRVLWISTECSPGSGYTIDDTLLLRVRIGWITRKEVITLNPVWALTGPITGTCGGPRTG
jgi:hypothetical protein